MSRTLCILGTVVSVAVLLIFGIDLAMGVPFGGASMPMSIVMILCSLMLGFASWSTIRELK